MSYQATHPGYSVRVDGIALGRTRFAIQATVDYASQLSRQELVPMAQLELLLAIVGEWERAVRSGARFIRVAVLGDGALDRFFRRWAQARLSSSVSEERRPSDADPRPGARRRLAASGRPTPTVHAGE